MEIRKLEKIHLVRTGDLKKEDYETLIAFIEAICEKENREKAKDEYSNSLLEKISDPADADLFTQE